mgnify:CR=1 FL=1
MNNKFLNIFFLNLFILFSSTIAKAQPDQFSQNIANKLIKIVSSDSPITRKDYNDFWKSTGIKSQAEKLNLISIMRANYFTIQQYNTILWECAEKSWADNKIYDCQKINKNYLKIRNQVYQLLGDEEFKKIDNNFNNVIKISAKRGGSMSPDLEEEPITLEKVQYAKRASQLMLQKIDIIMQPEFK